MKRLGFAFMACAACGGAAAASGETTPIIVPSQPPQPTATSATSPANVDASARTVAQVKPFECKTGQRFETTTRTYCAYADALPWDAAEHRCVENGGHLATLDSAAVNDGLHSVLGSPQAIPRAAWIGLEMKKAGAKKEWRWSNGAAVTAPAWSNGEPNDFYGDGTEACGEWLVTDGRWNDTRCNLVLPFLCQMTTKPLTCSGDFRTLLDGKYCLVHSGQTHANAKRNCTSFGGALAGPLSEAEQDVLRKTLAARFAPRRFWIGLNDIAEEGSWRWSSGAPLSFDAWEPGEPNDYQKEDCVEVYAETFTWNDFDCSAPKASVCESPPKKR
jgi:hypothetical protein